MTGVRDFDSFRVRPGSRVRLKGLKTEHPSPYGSKDDARFALHKGVEEMAELQNRLYANNSWSLLLIFQAMDAAGKDSTIRHVMSGLNPQGVQVHSFKVPSDEELGHDFLWRTTVRLPERGKIGVFNRSYYEEVLVVRVHPEFLERQRIPNSPRKLKKLWDERYEDINAMERHLDRNGTIIRKFFLHVSKEEQKRRFLKRLDKPSKSWKFSVHDLGERKLWAQYMDAYEKMLSETSTSWAPWYVIPADNEWFMRFAVAGIIVDTLRDLKLRYPRIGGDGKKALAEARRALMGEGGTTRKRRGS